MVNLHVYLSIVDGGAVVVQRASVGWDSGQLRRFVRHNQKENNLSKVILLLMF